MISRRLRKLLRWAGRVLAAVAAVLLGYVAAGLIGGAIPSNRDWVQPDRGITVYVESNGIHVGIVMPKVAAGPGWRVDWRPVFGEAPLRDPRYAGYDHVGVGWGEAKFYLETPTWWDVRPATVAAAAFGSARTLLHVDHVPAPTVGSDVRAIRLTPAQYLRLSRYIRATLADRASGRPGYGANDAFYEATGRYSAVRTCNAWAGDALRYAGVRVGVWTPFPATVLWWF